MESDSKTDDEVKILRGPKSSFKLKSLDRFVFRERRGAECGAGGGGGPDKSDKELACGCGIRLNRRVGVDMRMPSNLKVYQVTAT